MNYIGSKYKLIPFIKKAIKETVKEDISSKIFCDIFAGTGVVGRAFKKKVSKVISNDIEYYSYVLNRNYIGNHKPIKKIDEYIDILNNTKPVEGFIYKNYCMGGECLRQYFSDDNGKKIDAIRQKIKNWQQTNKIDENTFFFLLSSLLESADKVANTASVYGAFLKHLKKSAKKDMVLKPAIFEVNKNNHKVFNEDSNVLIKKIYGDILYLDPPYNARQYGANYHLLNTISKYDNFTPKGKTGLRDYNRSFFCQKNQVKQTFEHLIKEAKFKYIFLSYNNEGLMTIEEIKTIMQKFGKYSFVSQDYQRFKADTDENRNHKAKHTKEFLHILKKDILF